MRDVSCFLFSQHLVMTKSFFGIFVFLLFYFSSFEKLLLLGLQLISSFLNRFWNFHLYQRLCRLASLQLVKIGHRWVELWEIHMILLEFLPESSQNIFSQILGVELFEQCTIHEEELLYSCR